VIDRAVELTQIYRLRGYDAVQLARALIVRQVLIVENLPVPTFVTSDADLLAAAEAERLPIDNPLRHTERDERSSSDTRHLINFRHFRHFRSLSLTLCTS
jgi:hypothetical protein